MNLKLSEWANVAEIIGTIAILISLVFIGSELRSNTNATQASTREAINQKDLNWISMRLDPTVIARAEAKLYKGEDELSTLEENQLVTLQYMNFISFEHSYYQYISGTIVTQEWERQRNFIRVNIQRNPYASEMWEDYQYGFTSDFQEIVEELQNNGNE